MSQQNTHILTHFDNQLALFQIFYQRTPSNIQYIKQTYVKTVSRTLCQYMPCRLLPLKPRINLINHVVPTIIGPIGARLRHDLHYS